MADFPEVSGVITKIVSSVVPPRAYVFMVALLPGLFFELSILLADPALVCDLVARARDGLGLGHYEILGLSLVIAYVIGNALILLVTLIQRLLAYPYKLRAWVWEELCAWPLSPLVVWLGRKQWWGRRQRFRDFSMYVQERASGMPADEGARKLWAIIGKRLLREKYGVEPKDLGQEEWNALYWTLGTLTITDVRGSMTMIVFEATGWAGLAATLFAHQLWNRYYVGLSALLILAGLLHDWHVAGNLNNFRFLAYLKIRSLLREFPRVTDRTSSPDPDANSESEPD
jgi:hypothetical protein